MLYEVITRIYMVDYRNPGTPKLISNLNIRDRYNDIGSPVTTELPNGRNVVLIKDGNVFLEGRGSTPQGDRPFLRKMNLGSLETTEIRITSYNVCYTKLLRKQEKLPGCGPRPLCAIRLPL